MPPATSVFRLPSALIGTTFLAGDLWFEAFAVPWLGDVAPAAFHLAGGTLVIGAFTGYVLFAVGWVLFGLASLRARVFPRPISIAIVIGGVIGFQAALPPFAIPLALAIGALGIWMIRTSGGCSRRDDLLVAGARAAAEAGSVMTGIDRTSVPHRGASVRFFGGLRSALS